jgi:hypothetical protein
MSHHVPRLAGVAVAIAALLGLALTFVPSATASVHAPVSIKSVGACAPATVVNWLNTTADGTAGSVYYQIEFTNVSTQRCSLVGYPGVSAVNAANHIIGGAAARTPATPHVVDLAVGASAEAALQVTITGNFSASACEPQTARGLRVYAPNATTSDVIPFPFSTCANAHTLSLHIGPVRPA